MRSAAIALDTASVAAATIAMRIHKNTSEHRTPFIRTRWFTLRQMSAPWAVAQRYVDPPVMADRWRDVR
jgi:hypothetical protein